jgi:hypothetical protein
MKLSGARAKTGRVPDVVSIAGTPKILCLASSLRTGCPFPQQVVASQCGKGSNFMKDRKGKYFLAYNAKGELLRRGCVVRVSRRPRRYHAAFVDVLSGTFLGETRTVNPEQTTHWRFYRSLSKLNEAYENHFRGRYATTITTK